MKITDLDELVGVPRKVRLGGEVYSLPHDCPAELYVLLLKVAGADDEVPEVDTIQALRDGVLELFQAFQPEMTQLPSTMSLEMMVGLVATVYGGAEGPTDPKPKAASKGGTRSTPRRSTSRSR